VKLSLISLAETLAAVSVFAPFLIRIPALVWENWRLKFGVIVYKLLFKVTLVGHRLQKTLNFLNPFFCQLLFLGLTGIKIKN